MDWIMFAVVGIVLVLLIVFTLIMFAGWVAKHFFGKSDSWLDYGIDDNDLL